MCRERSAILKLEGPHVHGEPCLLRLALRLHLQFDGATTPAAISKLEFDCLVFTPLQALQAQESNAQTHIGLAKSTMMVYLHAEQLFSFARPVEWNPKAFIEAWRNLVMHYPCSHVS
jgi:hypothetical protein